MARNEIPLLHIYGQLQWHDECYIVANRDGLACLKGSIQEALDKGESSVAVYASDGEGYTIKVILNDSGWLEKFWDDLALPYTDETARAVGIDTIQPWEIKKEAK